MKQEPKLYQIEKSAVITFIGIALLFSTAVGIVLIAPNFVDPSWHTPTTSYMKEMYEEQDPNFYISALQSGSEELQAIYHLRDGKSYVAFQESETVRIFADPKFEKYVTRLGDKKLKLVNKALLLQKMEEGQEAMALRKSLQEAWKKEHPDSKDELPSFEILQVWDPPGDDAFAVASTDRIVENYVDRDFEIIDGKEPPPRGVIYVLNPMEYRVKFYTFGDEKRWGYDAQGERITSLDILKAPPMGFRSRKELIAFGEHTYAIEGCWYCHTDQTRTLVQDVVLNGSDSFPAPPSSANEYIYQNITFPGTRRIGPDLSRVGVKKPSRDWHKAHFWAPKTQSKGSIMPSFRHFFDTDPRGTARSVGIPNYKFEAVFQYLMTKGTRITPPTEAWWLGLDPVQTIKIIEGEKKS